LCTLFAATVAAAPLRPTHAPHAIVTSVHELASHAGVEMLRSGGNAVDAAVATGCALAVVHPQAGNLGGGGFLLLRNANGETHFIDFREKAPAAATENMYLDAQGNVVPNASQVGYKAIGVPGSVAGLVYAEQHWGKLSLRAVMAPAIKLAREGVRLTYQEARSMRYEESSTTHLEEERVFLGDARRIFQRNGKFYEPGEIFRQPELARTLERIVANPKASEFYKGAMALELAAEIKRGGGLMMLGGRRSFAEGGWTGTPLAEVLPVQGDLQLLLRCLLLGRLPRMSNP